MFDTWVIEISRSAYEGNLRFLRERVGEHAVFSCVVKGNAYGHGIEAFVPMAERAGVRHFSVFSAAEAYRVLQAREHLETEINIPNVTVGDEVMLIGRQGKLQITVGSFADLTSTLNDELLARLPADIPRIVTE